MNCALVSYSENMQLQDKCVSYRLTNERWWILIWCSIMRKYFKTFHFTYSASLPLTFSTHGIYSAYSCRSHSHPDLLLSQACLLRVLSHTPDFVNDLVLNTKPVWELKIHFCALKVCLIVCKVPHDWLAFNWKTTKKTDRKKQGDRRKVRKGECRVTGLLKQGEFGTQKWNVLKAFQNPPASRCQEM